MPATNGSVAARNLVQVSPTLLTTESVASSWYVFSRQYARTLPAYVDDVTSDFGADLYDRMLFDSQVSACMAVFKASILEDGVKLAPAIDDDTDPAYDLATQIQEEAERMLEDLAESLDDVLWDLLDSLALGNKIAEQVFDVRARTTDGKPGLQLASLKVKPRGSYFFVVDVFENTVGILGRRPGEAAPAGGTLVIDPANPPENLFPKSKFAIATFRPKDGDPRGRSVLRPAYDPWWRKRAALTEYVKYLAQFAGPSMWANTPEGAQLTPPLDSLGNLISYAAPSGTDPLGNPQPVPTGMVTPEQDLLGKMEMFRNGSVLVVPYGTELHTIQMQGEGRAFLAAIAECNMSITKAILTQTLTTEEGEHQARAAAQVHQDVLDTLVKQGKRSTTRMLSHQILRPWVAYNWGDKAADTLVPKVSLGSTEQTDLAPMINAMAALYSSGYLHPSQLPEIDTELNLPVRDLSQDEVVPTEPAPPAEASPVANADGAAPSQTPRPSPDAPSTPTNRVAVRGHDRGRPQRRQPQETA